jgi:preprotein translocase subunit SecE
VVVAVKEQSSETAKAKSTGKETAKDSPKTMETKTATADAKAIAGGVAGWPSAIRDYYDELKQEMRRVTWPNMDQVKATTVVVILAVFAFAAYFAVVDLVLGRGITEIFRVLTK